MSTDESSIEVSYIAVVPIALTVSNGYRGMNDFTKSTNSAVINEVSDLTLVVQEVQSISGLEPLLRVPFTHFLLGNPNASKFLPEIDKVAIISPPFLRLLKGRKG